METAKEVRSQPLPKDATVTKLEELRKEACSESSKDFHLQSFQLYLRRILSPESPNRNMLLFHGTGVGKTCTAIQIAEEYILRPEFQSKKVIVLAGRAVQGSFRNQIFDVTREEPTQQCTGRRYLDMLQRAQKDRLRLEDPDRREELKKTLDSLIDDFYDFEGYLAFANRCESIRIHEGDAGIHREFDNRLIIVDEAHNLRVGDDAQKMASGELENLLKVANGVTLVLLTATPMFDTFDEVLYYFNLFLWNDKRQKANERQKVESFFDKNGDFVSPERKAQFQGWCHEYVSFIRGENPFTFPFRLPPPEDMISPPDRQTTPRGEAITEPRTGKLPLVGSMVSGPQKDVVELAVGRSRSDMIYTLITSPIPGKKLADCFVVGSNELRFRLKYAAGVPAFLSPSRIANHAAKFATVIKCIEQGTGVVFVYSNFVRYGVEMFAAALEEHGFTPYVGPRMLENVSGEVVPGSAGSYVLLSETNIDRVLPMLRSRKNVDGSQIKVILGSPFVSEGVDFKYVRQVHILDPWDNLSRMEQIIGRGLRTCSHSLLSFKEQNCTVYLHVCRLPGTQEALDEYVYRDRVERKAKQIAKIKKVLEESALDCSLQRTTNSLPREWKDLPVPQIRSQDKMERVYTLYKLAAPTFLADEEAELACAFEPPPPDESYVRPLSSYLDVQDEVFNTLLRLFKEKPIWGRSELISHPEMMVDEKVVKVLLQNAVDSALRIKDTQGREGTLESKGEFYAFKPFDTPDGATMVERLTTSDQRTKPMERIEVREEEAKDEGVQETPVAALNRIRRTFGWKYGMDKMDSAVLNWYIADTVLSKDDKKKLLLSLPREGELPPFMKGLVVPGTDLLVLGAGEIYNAEGENTVPVGREKDAFEAWIAEHIESITKAVKTENKLVCTMGETKAGFSVLKFAAFTVENGKVVREKREKTIKAKECGFFTVTELATLAEEVNPPGFPEGVVKKEDKCLVLGLTCRQASMRGHPLIYWVPPELMNILSEEPYKTKLRSSLK